MYITKPGPAKKINVNKQAQKSFLNERDTHLLLSAFLKP